MPRLWDDTIEAHRREVREAILRAAAELVANADCAQSRCPRSPRRPASDARRSISTFPTSKRSLSRGTSDRSPSASTNWPRAGTRRKPETSARLEAVLEAFRLIAHESRSRHDTELAVFLHRDEQVTEAEQQLREMISDLVREGAAAGDLRDRGIAPDELAAFCLHAVTAAGDMTSRAAVSRLVTVILAGMQRSSRSGGRRSRCHRAPPRRRPAVPAARAPAATGGR